ncbi:MAG: acylphosphatase [Acidobacteriota bacterium]
MLARRFIIRGRVQGVGFRYFVYEAAHQLGLCGWVANRRDGTVEVHAETEDPAKMRSFLALVSTGPPHAYVDDYDVRDVEPENCESFCITR